MKKINLYIIPVIIIICSYNSNAQYGSYANYFPLNVGNIFCYKNIHCGPGGACDTAYRTSRILYSKSFNGKTYYYCQSYLGWGSSIDSSIAYLRFDTVTGYLMKYEANASGCGFELKSYKLSAGIGDSIGTNCASLPNYRCERIFDTTLFGSAFNCKKFTYSNSSINSQTINYTFFGRNVGAIYVYTYTATVHSSQTYKHYLRGACINGVLYGDTSLPIGIKQVSTELPNSFSLSQNYPNPFNPTTKIRFDVRPPLNPLLSKEGKDGWQDAGRQGVVLKVYDILGREIQTLVNEQLSPGTYEVEFDPEKSGQAGLSSGVYYYQLTISNEQLTIAIKETKRMVLLR
ncbi:MAG TPA: hypothetical protein VJ455_09775 [Ignavibacteria bacterium]|nr:hypothetical protein [Ignavibacteria bacterium]